jgi:hypothetical protein
VYLQEAKDGRLRACHIEYPTRQWRWSADMDDDGSITITDVWLWARWLFFYPGDLMVAGGLGRFLGIDSTYYGGSLSFWISAALWLFVGLAVGAQVMEIRERLRARRELAE